jgi:hypothetical protein
MSIEEYIARHLHQQEEVPLGESPFPHYCSPLKRAIENIHFFAELSFEKESLFLVVPSIPL